MAQPRTRQRKSALQKILRPLTGNSHRRAAVDIHHYLRECILSNALRPNTVLSQVEVADCLRVSRTPVREALRMLMDEGLVNAEPNFRSRVLGFDPQELEALYVSRIANEGIAAAATLQRMTDDDIKKLGELLRELRKSEKRSDLPRWLKHHRLFHEMLFQYANPLLRKRMLVDCQRSERYVYNAVQAGLSDLFRRADIEHEKIYQACKRRQPAAVVALLADHLAAAAVDIIAKYSPDWDPATLRNAAQLIRAGAAVSKHSARR